MPERLPLQRLRELACVRPDYCVTAVLAAEAVLLHQERDSAEIARDVAREERDQAKRVLCLMLSAPEHARIEHDGREAECPRCQALMAAEAVLR